MSNKNLKKLKNFLNSALILNCPLTIPIAFFLMRKNFAYWICYFQDDHVKASLPLDDYSLKEYTDLETQLIVCLSVGLAFAVAEFFLLIIQIPSMKTATISIIWHTTAGLLLLKFCVDSHPVKHFWIIFGAFSVPTLLLQAATFFSWINFSVFC